MNKIKFACGVLIVCLFCSSSFAERRDTRASIGSDEGALGVVDDIGRDPGNPLFLDFGKCIDVALKNNRHRKISEYSIEIAELQHKQALSSYWPHFLLNASVSRFDEDPNFVFAGSGFNDLKVKLMDREMRSSSLDLTYPLYTGGLRKAISQQAEIGVRLSKEDMRRTELQIVYDVKRMYYSVILTQKLEVLGKDILSHFEALLTVTEMFFTSGSLSVNKCDYLRIKTITESLKALVASLESNVELSKAGLLNTIGMAYDTAIVIEERELPYLPFKADLSQLVSKAYVFNPDWRKMNAGLEALELMITEKKSGRLPKLVLAGKLFTFDSSFDAGLMSETNADGYTVGLYMQMPVFQGFLTQSQIREARLALKRAESQKILLKEGIAVQIKHAFIHLNRYMKEIQSVKEAASSAEENRALSLKAYENQIVELKSVTEALILEAFVKMQYLNALYHHIEAQANLEFVIGQEINQMLGTES